MIDVVQEAVQGADALLQPLRQPVPFLLRQDARNGVERDQALGARRVAVDGEGDADAVEEQVRFAPLFRYPLGGSLGEPLGNRPEMRPSAARISSNC